MERLSSLFGVFVAWLPRAELTRPSHDARRCTVLPTIPAFDDHFSYILLCWLDLGALECSSGSNLCPYSRFAPSLLASLLVAPLASALVFDVPNGVISGKALSVFWEEDLGDPARINIMLGNNDQLENHLLIADVPTYREMVLVKLPHVRPT